jgi:hypothetical protein
MFATTVMIGYSHLVLKKQENKVLFARNELHLSHAKAFFWLSTRSSGFHRRDPRHNNVPKIAYAYFDQFVTMDDYNNR